MTRGRPLALLVVLVALAAAGCGPTSADVVEAPRLDAPAAVPFAEVDQLAREARASWPASACAGPVDVRRVPTLSRGAIGRTQVEPTRGGYRCSVLLADGAFACRELLRLVLVHEFGHLAGREHETEGIMAARIDVEAACR